MILIKRKYFDLLFEHYKYVKFIENTRYFMSNMIVDYNFQNGFSSEETFRRTLNKVKPIFIANYVDTSEWLIFDIDYKLTNFTEEDFNSIKEDIDFINKNVNKMLTIVDSKLVFSGRGIHLYYKPLIFKRVNLTMQEMNIIPTHNVHLIMYELIYSNLDNKLKYYKNSDLKNKIDRTTMSVSKLMRTPYSINDRSFLPVVEFSIEDFLSKEITIDKILNVIREPRTYKIIFKKQVPVRVYDRTEITDEAIVDEYEMMRQVLKNNYNIKKIEEF